VDENGEAETEVDEVNEDEEEEEEERRRKIARFITQHQIGMVLEKLSGLCLPRRVASIITCE
jgi:hypothetical protein